jgi:RES domain
VIPPLHVAELPDLIYRLGRAPDPWEWPDWSYAGPDGTFGNRFDDPDADYRVLYASTQRQATIRECLARFRPDPVALAAALDDLDAGDIRARAPRRFTQEISRYVFAQAVDGAQAFAGIRYASRLGDEFTNWAVFEPNEPVDRDDEELAPDDPDLLAVAEAYELKLSTGS